MIGMSCNEFTPRLYEAIHGIRFNGMQYRTDIGHRAVKQAGEAKAAK